MARRSDDDLAYGERWDRDRMAYERDRFEERDRYYTRAPVRERVREASVDERFVERRAPRPWEEDDYVIEKKERRFYEEEPRRRRSPPPELERRLVLKEEQERDVDIDYRSTTSRPRPRPRPGMLRRQSSLDTFDRRPATRLYEHEREEFSPPPLRRGDYRPEPYQPIPLPRSRALPPPRIYAERDYDEIKISEPRRYGDEEFRAYPEHITEREVVRSRRRERSGSRTSGARTHRSSHRSSRRSSSSSSSSESDSKSAGGTTVTTKSEYPKKGKTRIPARLVSLRAIMDLQYPYVEEGGTIIIQKALGQSNIDDLLRLSEEYKKVDAEVSAARSSAAIEERREETFTIPPSAPPPPPVEVVKETVIREISPARTVRTRRSHSTSTSRTPYVIEAGPREVSDEIAVGPLALVSERSREKELVIRDGGRHHHHHHHSHSRGRGELIQAERLPTGELVLYEEEIEKIEEPRRGVRIEKDKKGRMSISVPKYTR
ncbi:hypothetical protein F5Y16DRAFT_225924 [Xylariaceae sp. FL0255]|nr:hypothetical protein F5Y16DRAFT_225924 [Xylariaceae sp. FL0255]